MDSATLVVFLFIGFLSIEIALTGKLGSILGSIIDPSAMHSGVTSSSTSSSNALTSFEASNTNATEVVSIITSVFGQYADQALKIATCESSLNPAAVNTTPVGDSHATGVFQILYPSTWNTTSYRTGNPKDARTNILAAYEIFKRDNYTWREWACASIVGV